MPSSRRKARKDCGRGIMRDLRADVRYLRSLSVFEDEVE